MLATGVYGGIEHTLALNQGNACNEAPVVTFEQSWSEGVRFGLTCGSVLPNAFRIRHSVRNPLDTCDREHKGIMHTTMREPKLTERRKTHNIMLMPWFLCGIHAHGWYKVVLNGLSC